MVEGQDFHAFGKAKSDIALGIFFSLTACLVLGWGCYYWLRLVGIYDVENWRFDLMSWPWRLLSVSLAVFYPVAACGLWQQARWGVILWLVGAVSEAVCFTALAASFSFNLFVPLLHLVFLLAYVGLSLYRYLERKQGSNLTKS